MKQPGLFFILLGPIYIVSTGIGCVRPKEIVFRNICFGIGAIIPFAGTCLLLWSLGVLNKFWFWTVVYARDYASLVPLSFAPKLLANSFSELIGESWPFWLLAGFGLFAGFLNKITRVTMGWLLGLLAVSTLALSSGLYFRNHYFILTLPAVSLLVGVAINQLVPRTTNRSEMIRFAPLCILAVAASLSILLARKIYFTASPIEICRMLYKANPFPESIKIAEYLRNHTDPNETIGVLGSEPEIYFYSSRHSATGYVYTYSLMEAQKNALLMQQEMIREIEQARPKYLVFVKVPTSWLTTAGSETLVQNWAKEYLAENYEMVGLVHIAAADQTDYYFDVVPDTLAGARNTITVFARKS
jgi:hypothetical protein